MAADKEKNIYVLDQGIKILQKSNLEELNAAEQKDLGSAMNLYLGYCTAATGHDYDNRIESGGLQAFFFYKPFTELQAIINLLSKEKESEVKEQKQKVKEEEITVPVELESLVAQYKQFKADELDADTTTHTTAAAIKRAVATWQTRHRAEVIRENRLALIQDETERNNQREKEEQEQDRFLINAVNAKAESARVFSQNIERISRQTIIAQTENLGLTLTKAQIDRAIKDLSNAGLSGAINFDNFKNINAVAMAAFSSQGIDINSPAKDIYTAEVARRHEEEVDKYSDKPDQLQEYINKRDEESQRYFETSSKNLFARLNRENPDIKDELEAAAKDQQTVLAALLMAVPNATLPATPPSPLSQNMKAFEVALRQADPQLRINPSDMASEVEGILIKTGETRELGPEAIHLLGIGLTPTRFEEVEKKAIAEPNSPIGKLYITHKNVFDQVKFQIKRLSDPNSKIGKEISEKLKPLTGISSSLATFYNSNPAVQVAKGVMNPVGTAKAWAGREAGKRIGKYLIENSSSLMAKKFGGYLMEHGLKKGISTFTSEAAKRLAIKAATWAALRLGISLTAESLNAILPGLGLLIDIALQAAVWLLEKTYGALQNLAESVYGEKIKARDLLAPLVVLGGAAAGAGAAAFGGFIFITRTVQLAAISAVGIIIGAIITMALYLGAAYLIAPMLSTLVQFDAFEKVDYAQYGAATATASSDCAWPTTGHYEIVTGPGGGTHDLSDLEAIDISAPKGSPFLAVATGVVTFAGVYSNYGNTVQMQTTTSAGSFVAYYAHLDAIMVGVGQQVGQGKPVGLVGGSGGWSPHIHIEYKGIKYNQCPAGGLVIKEKCCTYSDPPKCSGACNAFSN